MQENEKNDILRPMVTDEAVSGEPVDVCDQINKYGTYECQDTTDTDNVFPLIGPFGAGINGVTLPSIPDAVEEKYRSNKGRD